MQREDPARLRIASYNVYQARRFGTESSRSVLRDFASLDPLRTADVILLQEALAGQRTDGGPAIDTVATLAQSLGIAVDPDHLAGLGSTRFLGTVERRLHRWGLGIVTRTPARFTDVPLPNAWWTRWPRAALVAEVGSWILVTLHLEVWPLARAVRRQQMQTVVDSLLRFAGNQIRPVVVAGDFNCESGGAHDVLRRSGFTPALAPGKTWSWGLLTLQLDHVYVRGARVVSSGIERSARGSDHRPVWVDLERDVRTGPIS